MQTDMTCKHTFGALSRSRRGNRSSARLPTAHSIFEGAIMKKPFVEPVLHEEATLATVTLMAQVVSDQPIIR